MTISPELSTPAVVLAIPLLAALALDPWLGRRLYNRLERNQDNDSRARTRFYQRIILLEWAAAALVGAIVLTSPGADARDFGLALPVTSLGFLPGTASELAGAAVGLLLAGVLCWFAFRKLFADAPSMPHTPPGMDGYRAMLPRTAGERRYAIATSVTAGICEEVVYRGFLIAFGVGVLGLHPYLAGALAALLFGAAHLYQGKLGMLRVTGFGILMTALYLGTGSLLLPILIHAAGDIVSLVVVPSRLRTDVPDVPDVQPAEAS